MTVLNVAVGGSIQAAIDAASPGDTIAVQAGIYTNQFLSVGKSVTLQGVGGQVVLTATVNAPNGKAIITEGAAGLRVAINNFSISGAVVNDHNGAAIRYEGGALSLSNDWLHNNQEGLLGASDPNGRISITYSEIDHNGDGSGSTHNLYIGTIASFKLTYSFVHDASVGHEIKSRAAINTIIGNRIFDNNSSASYNIDLPNGGNTLIKGNVIEQGAHTQNPAMIAYGEEGLLYTSNTIAFTNNKLVNDDPGGTFLLNPTHAAVGYSSNSSFGFASSLLPAGSGNVLLTTRPGLNETSLSFSGPTFVPVPPPPPVLHGHNDHHHAVHVAVIASDHQ